MTREEFGAVLMMRAALWDNAKPLTEAQEGVWFDILQEFPGEHVKAALMAYSRDGQAFAPVVGQVVAKVKELTDDTPDWGSAWRELRDRCDGSLGTPDSWSHPAVWEAARRITLREIGDSERGDTAFEAQCRGVYESVRDGYRAGERYRGLPGIRPGLIPAGVPRLDEPEAFGEIIRTLMPGGSDD